MHHDNYASAIFSYAFHQIYTNGKNYNKSYFVMLILKLILTVLGLNFKYSMQAYAKLFFIVKRLITAWDTEVFFFAWELYQV